ncbi:carbohydrate kinase family protein [Sphaerochaeta sp.]|uniref:carbohydrate kinase family protein n=1 Tax=Sphaerochaeta sp. TaxID=1972642 RepID=UPI003D134B1E
MISIIGEGLIDFIARTSEDASVVFDSYIGGCGLNTATAAARLGSSVGFMGKLSSDMFGERIIGHLVDNQIMFDPDLCAVALPSLIGFASLDAEGKASYAFYCKGTAPVSYTKQELLDTLVLHSDLRVVHIGSVALSVEPGCDAILDALSDLEIKPVVFLDPNVRPAVIEDLDLHRVRIERALGMADMVKLSDEDLLLLYPGCDAESKAASLAGERGLEVILTLGKKGSIWFTASGKRFAQPIIDLPLVDTVGAGDTFSGALLSYLHEHACFGEDGQLPLFAPLSDEVIRQALRYATGASAINCSRKGCNPPTKAEVLDLIGSV